MSKRKFVLDEKGNKIFLKDGEGVQEEEVKDPELTDEPTVDDAAAAEEKKLLDGIVSKLTASLKDIKETKEAEEKKKALLAGADVKLMDPQIKLYTTRRGKEVSMRKSEIEQVNLWFKALLRKDYGAMLSVHQKLEPLIEGTNAEGGFLVPTVLYNTIVPLLEEEAVFRSRAFIIDMTGMKTNQLNIDGIATKPVVSWGSENAAKATSSATFNQIGLTPYLAAAIVPLSKQLRDDSPFNVVQIVSKLLAEALAKLEDAAFMNGNGTGRPTGINNYTFTGPNAGGALSYDHILAAYWRLPSPFRSKASWIMNSRTIEAISTLKDSNNRHLLLDSGILTEPGIPALKGRPVLEQNDCPSASIFFGDISAYWIGLKLPLTIDIADQAVVAGVSLWERNLIAVRIEERIDGELTTTRAFTEITNSGVS